MTRSVFIPHLPTRYEPLNGGRVPTIDLTPAAEFGRLVLLSELERSGSITQEVLPRLIGQINFGMAAFKAGDCIVAVGDPILVAAAISYASDLCGSVTVLRWDRHTKSYSELEVTL